MRSVLTIAAASLVLAACATTPSTTKVASTNVLGTRTDAGQAAAPQTFKGLYSQSWVKDEDAKDKNGPDGLAYR